MRQIEDGVADAGVDYRRSASADPGRKADRHAIADGARGGQQGEDDSRALVPRERRGEGRREKGERDERRLRASSELEPRDERDGSRRGRERGAQEAGRDSERDWSRKGDRDAEISAEAGALVVYAGKDKERGSRRARGGDAASKMSAREVMRHVVVLVVLCVCVRERERARG